MAVDILDLAAFYHQARGQWVRRILAARMRALWSPIADDGEDDGVAVGYGYVLPYAADIACRQWHWLMPAQQGVMVNDDAPCSLIDESLWPLRDNSVNRLVMVHGLEAAHDTQAVLAEAARVLMPMGRLLLVVPNRTGLWARYDNTPFGFGKPFSRAQIMRHLKKAELTCIATQSALILPPALPMPLLTRTYMIERLMRFVLPQIGGVWVVDATKYVPAHIRMRPARARKTMRPILAR